MPSRGAASIMWRADSAPARWPAERGSPREVAHRPLPSVMMATCKPAFGEPTNSACCEEAGAGGREGCMGTTCEVVEIEDLLSGAEHEAMRVSSLRRGETNLRNHSGVKLALLAAGKLLLSRPLLQSVNYLTNYFAIQSA